MTTKLPRNAWLSRAPDHVKTGRIYNECLKPISQPLQPRIWQTDIRPMRKGAGQRLWMAEADGIFRFLLTKNLPRHTLADFYVL